MCLSEHYHTILDKGLPRGLGKEAQEKSDSYDFEKAGSICFPLRPSSPAAFVSRECSGCSTKSAHLETVPFRCDTVPSRTGSAAQSGPVGRGRQRVAVAVAGAKLRGRSGREWPCSGSLRPWVVAAAVEKGGSDDAAGELDRAGRR